LPGGRHEEGSFCGESWSLSSYALLEQAVITMAQSQQSTVDSLQSGSYAGQRTFGGLMSYNLSGTFLDGESGHPV
jgi:hypothetical protein